MATWKERAPEIQSMLDQGKTNADIAKHYDVSRKTVRNRLAELRAVGLIHPLITDARASFEIGSDGNYKSEKPLWMTLDQVKDPEYLLKAHGFEPDAWELVSAKNNIWNTNDKIHGIQTLYGSKITVKPKVQGWTFEQLLEAIRSVTPVTVEKPPANDCETRMLEIPLFDMHFGNSDYGHYKTTQQKIYSLINSRRWEETLFIVGQDLFHNDNFKGTTANGTPIENVDMPKAWGDCEMFYSVLMETAIQQSQTVKVLYSKGNHDESMSWAFVQWLKARYPQAAYDDSVKERKVHVFHRCFLGITHQDKGARDLINLFPSEFPMEWAATVTREIHAGHWHKEDAKDSFGIMRRTLSTANKTDKWHEDNGFTGAHKRFQMFEWSESAVESIHYV